MAFFNMVCRDVDVSDGGAEVGGEHEQPRLAGHGGKRLRCVGVGPRLIGVEVGDDHAAGPVEHRLGVGFFDVGTDLVGAIEGRCPLGQPSRDERSHGAPAFEEKPVSRPARRGGQLAIAVERSVDARDVPGAQVVDQLFHRRVDESVGVADAVGDRGELSAHVLRRSEVVGTAQGVVLNGEDIGEEVVVTDLAGGVDGLGGGGSGGRDRAGGHLQARVACLQPDAGALADGTGVGVSDQPGQLAGPGGRGHQLGPSKQSSGERLAVSELAREGQGFVEAGVRPVDPSGAQQRVATVEQ